MKWNLDLEAEENVHVCFTLKFSGSQEENGREASHCHNILCP